MTALLIWLTKMLIGFALLVFAFAVVFAFHYVVGTLRGQGENGETPSNKHSD